VTLKTNEESRQRKRVEEDSGKKKVPRQSAETRPPRPPAKGVHGEEPLGNMKRPTEKNFKLFSHAQPLADAETKETFEELVTRTAVKTHRQEESMRAEVDFSPTETEEVSPSKKASPTEEEEEREEWPEAPGHAPKKCQYSDFRKREKTLSDPGANRDRTHSQEWWSGKGRNSYSEQWNTRRQATQKHIMMPPEDSGPFKGLPKRFNTQTDRHEYTCECFDVWYDPEDMEKRSAI
jgi:hypothetical protein